MCKIPCYTTLKEVKKLINEKIIERVLLADMDTKVNKEAVEGDRNCLFLVATYVTYIS